LTIWRTRGDIPSFGGGEKVKSQKGSAPFNFSLLFVPCGRSRQSGTSVGLQQQLESDALPVWHRCSDAKAMALHRIGICPRHFSLIGCAGPVLGGPNRWRIGIIVFDTGGRSVVGLPSRWSVPRELLDE